MLTVNDFAKALDGDQYRCEGSRDLFEVMADNGIVAVFGASDDLMEFRGAIHDEIGAWDGATAFLNAGGLMQSECREGADCPYFKAALATAKTIRAIWSPDTGESWVYKTEIPHKTFRVMEDDEVYCVGIVFNLADAG